MNRIYILLAALAVIGTLIGSAYLKGRADGRSVEAAAQQEATDELNQELREVQEELATLEATRLEEMEALNAEVDELRRLANEDPDADRPAIGTGSVRRLNSLR
ncbi:MAG: hypothetical protein GOVbin4933_73 [Prokaryotic dsDNA virus sp.]|nr:MAG: hypothetical protein GOVbin4933_73 [Prokaryotic dsDNA virus sp.]|tara:strand:+ start:6942 stop:7253 length:312 start_codon:yes stop_codon:yes gene_type:complete